MICQFMGPYGLLHYMSPLLCRCYRTNGKDEAALALCNKPTERPMFQPFDASRSLRVCPDTLGRITKFSKHEPN